MPGFDGTVISKDRFNQFTNELTPDGRVITLEDGRVVTVDEPPESCKCCKCTQACCHSIWGTYAEAKTAGIIDPFPGRAFLYGIQPLPYDTYSNDPPDWVYDQRCRSLERCASQYGGPGQFAATPEICKQQALMDFGNSSDVIQSRYLPCDCDELDLCGFGLQSSLDDFTGTTSANLDFQIDSATGQPVDTRSRNVAFTPFSPLEIEGKTLTFSMQTSGSLTNPGFNPGNAGFIGFVNVGTFFTVSGRVVGSISAFAEGDGSGWCGHPWRVRTGGGGYIRNTMTYVNVAQHTGNVEAIRAWLPSTGNQVPPYPAENQACWAIGTTIGWTMNCDVTINNVTRGPDCTWLADIDVTMNFAWTGTGGGSDESETKSFSQVQLLPDSFEAGGVENRCNRTTPFIGLTSSASVVPGGQFGSGTNATISGSASTSASVPFDKTKNVFPDCPEGSGSDSSVIQSGGGGEPSSVSPSPSSGFPES